MNGRLQLRVHAVVVVLVLLSLPLAPTPGGSAAALWYVTSDGDNTQACTGPATACASIDGVLAKPGFTPGDTIRVSVGTYTGDGDWVVTLSKSAMISGGWNAAFSEQIGLSLIDGENSRPGVRVAPGTTSSIERVSIRNGRGAASEGGGLHNQGVLTLSASVVSDCAAGAGGGIYNLGVLTVTNSTISGNVAYLDSGEGGGGAYNVLDASLALENSTVSDNWSLARGGGISVHSGSVTLSNATLAGNTAGGHGGGLYVINGEVALRNTLISSNDATRGPDCESSVELDSWGYNLISDVSDCAISTAATDLTGVGAGLGELVGVPGTPEYRPLLPGSPAIDAGDPAGCVGGAGPLATDQRGAPRVGRCDIGAYEATSPGPATVVYVIGGSPQSIPPRWAFRLPLRAAVLDSLGSPVGGVRVAFAAPSGGASATFADTRTLTTTSASGLDGIATAAQLTANVTVGTYTVSAEATGVVTPATFALANRAWYVATGGSDAAGCTAPAAACASINGLLAKAGFVPGDTVLVGAGTYTGTGTDVVRLDRDVHLSGGWDAGFAAQTGHTTIDGWNARRCVTIDPLVEVTMERIIVQHGSAYAASGGGIENHGFLTMVQGAIRGNYAAVGGGVLNSLVLRLDRVSVCGNSTPPNGYGVLNSGWVIAENCTICLHKGGTGAVWTESGRVALANCTVTANSVGLSGSGDRAVLRNTIVSGNSEFDCVVGVTPEGHNVLGPSCWTGRPEDVRTTDPGLLAPMGVIEYYRPVTGGPAIDGGDPAGCTSASGNALTTDQRGAARPVDGDRDGQAVCDIGSVEVDPDRDTQVYLPCILVPCRPLYADDFSNPASGWPIEDYPTTRYEYVGGEYRILVKSTDWWAAGAPGFRATDYSVVVDVRNASGAYGTYGVIIGLSDDWRQLYSFEIDPNSNYNIWRLDPGSGWHLLANGASPYIHPGTATNRLRLDRSSGWIKAYANGQPLATVWDETYTGLRRLGLIASSFDWPNVDARFDNFAVYPATCEWGATAIGQASGAPGLPTPEPSVFGGWGVRER